MSGRAATLVSVLLFVLAQASVRRAFGPGDLVGPLISGFDLPADRDTSALPADARRQLEQYRARERRYQPSADLQKAFDDGSDEFKSAALKRIATEHVVFCLFERPDAREIAHEFASEMEFPGECNGDQRCVLEVAESAEQFISRHPRSPVLPYAHLVAGQWRLTAVSDETGAAPCAPESRTIVSSAERDLRLASAGGNALIRVLADYLRSTAPRCQTSSPEPPESVSPKP